MSPDAVNGAFELFGALAVLTSVHRVLRDRMVRGVSWAMVVYFTAWGAWNLYYYPHLGQTWSTLAAVAMFAVNMLYVSLLVYFTRLERRSA